MYIVDTKTKRILIVIDTFDTRLFSRLMKRFVLNAEKGRGKQIRFWAKRPYSRLLTWGRELDNVLRYVGRNLEEALRHIRYVPRKNRDEMRRTNEDLDSEARHHNPQLVLRM